MKTLQTYQEVMKSTTAVPQEFYVKNGAVLTNFYGSNSGGNTRTGSIVSNKLKPGTFGFVATLPTGTSARQCLLTKTFSNHGPSLNRTLEFIRLPESLAKKRPMQMAIRVTEANQENVITNNGELKFYHDGNGSSNLIPILVAPGSVSLADDWTTEELSEHFEINPDINWGNVLNGVVKAVPVIAEAGYTIYKQITSKPSNGGESYDYDIEEAEPMIFGAILSGIASIAKPLLSALL